MSKPKDEAIAAELVLAAVDRAQRHSDDPDKGVPVWTVLEHLGVPRRAHRARQVSVWLRELQDAGVLEQARRHGVDTWVLTCSGRRRLGRARAAGIVPELPESPQHRRWRRAQTAAGQEIERFSRELRELLGCAGMLLDAPTPTESDDWFMLSERLRHACWRVGSASYCLYEWLEPDEQRADIEEAEAPDSDVQGDPELVWLRARRVGRRNIQRWQGLDS